MNKPTVFISYSHKDEFWKDRLRPHLRVLEQQGQITIWDDRQIDAGAEWYDKIKQAMAEAAVSICLISADYLASDFCVKEEIPYLLERRKNDGMTLIPVLLRACAWKAVSWLKPLQMLPRDGKNVANDFKDNWDEVFAEVAEYIFEIVNAEKLNVMLLRSIFGEKTEPTFSLSEQLTSQFAPPEKIDLRRLPVTGSELFGRDNDLQQLDEIWESQNVNVISLVAWGGVGKSTLVNKWLERLGADNYRGARRVYGWSFYSQGTDERVTSADQFIAAALEWFGDPDPTKGSPWDKGERLAELVRQQKTLLILDGMEPLQSDLAFEHGKIKDPGLAVLVAELASKNNGLCVITTRELVADLQEADAGAMQKNLEQISAQAGRALLRVGGVQGTDAELEKATTDFGNHALAINLLAAYLHDIPGHHISHSREIPDLDIPEAKGRHPRRVMAAFELRWGESAALQVLRILGLFDRPAEIDAVDAVRRPPAIAGLTDQLQNLTEGKRFEVLENLRQHKLLAPRSRHNLNTLDCHPLVREHFGEKLKVGNATAWREAHRRLYEYYKAVPKKELPETLEKMGPLFAAVEHGCKAGLHRDALDDLFLRRMNRGDESYLIHQLGAPGAALFALSSFFEQPWQKLFENLPPNSHTYLLFISGLCLRAVGRLNDAAELYLTSLQISNAQCDWESAAVDAGSLSDLYVILGKLSEALNFAKIGLELSMRQNSDVVKQLAPLHIASAMHHQGNLREAEDAIEKCGINISQLPSVLGYSYCNLLLDQGRIKRALIALTPAQEVFKQKLDSYHHLDKALFYLSLGYTEMLNSLHEQIPIPSEAIKNINLSLENFRESGQQEFITRGLLARAELHRMVGDFPKAQHDLDKVFTIATRSGMRLHEADCHLEYARLHLTMNEKDKARESWVKAKKMIEEMGYHRRDPEIYLIEVQIHLTSGEKEKAWESLAKAKDLIDKMGMHRWDFEVKEIEEQSR